MNERGQTPFDVLPLIGIWSAVGAAIVQAPADHLVDNTLWHLLSDVAVPGLLAVSAGLITHFWRRMVKEHEILEQKMETQHAALNAKFDLQVDRTSARFEEMGRALAQVHLDLVKLDGDVRSITSVCALRHPGDPHYPRLRPKDDPDRED